MQKDKRYIRPLWGVSVKRKHWVPAGYTTSWTCGPLKVMGLSLFG